MWKLIDRHPVPFGIVYCVTLLALGGWLGTLIPTRPGNNERLVAIEKRLDVLEGKTAQ